MMRRLLPLVLLAAVAAGCGHGETSYSDAQVRQAFTGLIRQSQTYAAVRFRPQFATLEAVTELRIDEGLATPREEYVGAGAFVVLRFASPANAKVGEQAYRRLELALPDPGNASVTRRGNVLLVVTEPTPAAHDALERLH